MDEMNRGLAGSPGGAENAADRVLEYAYLLLLALYTLAAFRTTTMLDGSKLAFTYYAVSPVMRVFAALIVGARIARERPWRLRDTLLAVLLCGSLIRSWQHVERGYIFELAVLIAGAHGVDFGKIIRVHFFTVAAALAATAILALTGVIENLVYYRAWTPRMSFGIIYPTDFAAQVFFLAASWSWLRSERITWWEILVVVGLAVFCYVFCEARNSMACMLIMALGLTYLKLRRRVASGRGEEYTMTAPVRWLCILSAPLYALVMIVLSILYDGGSFMESLNGMVSDRIYFGHLAFRDYAVNLFGQQVNIEGLGGSTSPGEGYYFFLDSSYINHLFCFGAVTLAVLLTAYAISSFREGKNRSWERLGILAAVALQCAFEHHFIELAYNPFLLLTLAVSYPESGLLPRGSSGGGKHTAQ